MKKTLPEISPSESQRRVAQQTFRSVVTQLSAKRNKALVANEPEIDLEQLRAVIDELPTLNATKLVALHRRIVNGDYAIDSTRLAEKMIELEATLDQLDR
ncbi:MAG: flagellar biosynthesis anti-sigma factor FlgM [Pseudohongiellaceae bacterium]